MSYKRASAQPVIEGGTGVTTMTTAYAPVAAGTTATGALQVASTGLSSSGYIFTSTGASSLPSFQGNIALPATTSSVGQYSLGGSLFMHDYNSTSNTFVGITAGNLTSTGANCTGIGNNALHALSSGAQMTCVGTNAGQALTTSADSVAIGFRAVNAATTGLSQCVVIGKDAMLTASGTANNVAIGFNSMSACSTGNDCIAIGSNAMKGVLTGGQNIGIGSSAAAALTSGTQNVAIGYTALQTATTDQSNTAVGWASLATLNTSSGQNTAIGTNSMNAATTGTANAALGWETLDQITTGQYNVALGRTGGHALTTSDSHNIVINNQGTAGDNNIMRIGAGTGTGTQQLNKTFISGIQTIVVTGTPVLVSTSDQLGVAASSRRFKENIEDMGSASSAILNLRPVTFNYSVGEDHSPQVGLIAEEVEEIMPSLVSYDKDGVIFTVRYNDLPALLLNELQKALKRIDALEAKLASK